MLSNYAIEMDSFYFWVWNWCKNMNYGHFGNRKTANQIECYKQNLKKLQQKSGV